MLLNCGAWEDSFFFFSFFKFYFIFKLHNIVLVLPNIEINLPQVYPCSLKIPWTARSNQSILKEINLEYSLEGMILKLSLQYFGQLMWRANSLKKTDEGKDWRQEEKGVTEDEMVGRHRRFNGNEYEQTPGDSEGQGSLACCSPPVTKSQIQLSDWTTKSLLERFLSLPWYF